jgi:hypothetical protein
VYSYIAHIYLSYKNEMKLLEEGRVSYVGHNTNNEAVVILILRIMWFYYL